LAAAQAAESTTQAVLWYAVVWSVQVFDRPFLFFLVDGTTQTVLFQGAVSDPSKTG
jgi:serine protease inhibitor